VSARKIFLRYLLYFKTFPRVSRGYNIQIRPSMFNPPPITSLMVRDTLFSLSGTGNEFRAQTPWLNSSKNQQLSPSERKSTGPSRGIPTFAEV
jgi:hypothetical protein